MILLANRLQYYPVIQIISRAAAAWWDVKYGFNADSWSENYDTNKQVAQYIYDITNPFAGIGFCCVFLYVQPTMYRQFQRLMGWYFKHCCVCWGMQRWVERLVSHNTDATSTTRKESGSISKHTIDGPSRMTVLSLGSRIPGEGLIPSFAKDGIRTGYHHRFSSGESLIQNSLLIDPLLVPPDSAISQYDSQIKASSSARRASCSVRCSVGRNKTSLRFYQ